MTNGLPTSPTFLTQQLRVERTQFDFVAAEALKSDRAHKNFLKHTAVCLSPASLGLDIDSQPMSRLAAMPDSRLRQRMDIFSLLLMRSLLSC